MGCPKYCTCLNITATALCVVAVVAMGSIQVIYDSIVRNVVMLGDGKEIMEMFIIPPVPILMSFYFFDVQNPVEVQYYGEKPILKEKGPYVYEEMREKFDMEFSGDETTVQYKNNRAYFLREDLSQGSEADQITTLNMVMVLAAALFSENPYIGLIWPEIEAVMDVFETHSVGDLLFKGWEQPKFNFDFGLIPGLADYEINGTIAEIMIELGVPEEDIPELIMNNRIGYYNFANNTDDGLYEVFTGVADMSQYLHIKEYKNLTDVGVWGDEYCDMINGTDGTQFPPKAATKTSTLRIFVSELCRSLYLEYELEASHFGVDYLRFVAPPEVLQAPHLNPDNQCFCGPMDCLGSSLLEMTPCLGIPLVMSTPHFFMGDGDQLEKFIGLEPDKEKHETMLDIEPSLGIPVRAHKRIQVNFRLRRYGDLTSFMNFNDMIFPVLWADESAELSESDTAVMWKVVELPFIIVYSVGSVLLLVGLLMAYLGCKRNNHKKKGDTVELL